MNIKTETLFCSNAAAVFPLSWKNGTFGTFLDASRQSFWEHLWKLDAIFFRENFTNHYFVIFLKMCWTFFYNSSCSHVTGKIYKVYKNCSGHIFTIYAFKNKAVKFRCILEAVKFRCIFRCICCEVQMHFRSFCLARFIKNVLGRFSQFACLEMKLCAVKFRHVLKVFLLAKFLTFSIPGGFPVAIFTVPGHLFKCSNTVCFRQEIQILSASTEGRYC